MTTRMTRAATLPGWMLMGPLILAPAAATEPGTLSPMSVHTSGTEASAPRVMSNTLEYCDKLTSRIDALIFEAKVPPPSEVMGLSAEGRRMCAQGHVRGGVMRLRKALMIMQEIADSR